MACKESAVAVEKQKVPPSVFQLKLSVKDITPLIWRRVLVRSDVTLALLHKIIQALMGWANYHLYAFRDGKANYAPPRDDDDVFGKSKSIGVTLARLFDRKSKTITYEYDFGDGWKVELLLEKVLAKAQQKNPAVCIEGLRRGPAEDSGGPGGYMRKLEILGDRKNPDYKKVKGWFGPYFDPERFDVAEVNERLDQIRR